MDKPILHLELRDFLEGRSRFVVGRYHYQRQAGAPLHDHDFAEVFWITRGTCRHVFRDGEERLAPGEVRFIRPAQAHRLENIGPAPLHLTNIAFPAEALDTWERGYPVLSGHFYWNTGGGPGGIKQDTGNLEELENQAHRLATRTEDLFFLHRFLLDLFDRALPPAPDTRAIPGWLKQGLARLETSEVFGAGVPAFARACARSPEHVARACRKHLDQTPTELVNTARIRAAAQLLRMTDRDILNIMYDCGYANPTHFYRLFKARYGVPPRRYRLNQRQLVGQ